jgi:glycosyltransferase involved in cell wall biosynthesis
MKISLACIAGNCADLLPRFLDHFQPHFDEVIIVRAIGNQAADETLDIAKSRGCVTGEHLNASHPDWPHVDDFGAARNAAWKLASGDWIVWADMDDLTDGLELLRPMLEGLKPEVLMVQCPYVVPDQRIGENMRERAVRRGEFTWFGPIHECMTPVRKQEYPYVKTDKIKWIHRPLTSRQPSSERNLRILESIQDKAHGHIFYLFTELSQIPERGKDALEYAKQFLAHPDSSDTEKYEVFLMLAGMADSPETIAGFLHSAYRIAPHRAEALYELANLELTCGDPKRGQAYVNACRSLPWPKESVWNLRKEFYGRTADSLKWQAMRLNGEREKADALEFNAWTMAGGDISLIHATRGRPAKSSNARKIWLDRAKHPERIEHIFAFDSDDKDSLALARFRAVCVPSGGGCVAAWNTAAEHSHGQILVQLSDDWIPPQHWDEELRSRLNVEQPQVLKIHDGHRTDDLLCMAILTRKRYMEQGFLFHPAFTGVYSDNYFTDQAAKDGVIVHAAGLTFEHEHPIFDKSVEVDETYSKQNSETAYAYGKAVYDMLSARKLTWNKVEGWCDFQDLYHSIARNLKNGDEFVEVGCWKGQSIIFLAQTLQDIGKGGVKLYAVDTFKGELDQPMHTETIAKHGGSIRPVFEENIKAAGVSGMIEIIEADSVEASKRFKDGQLAGCFIDAAHEYEPVKADLAAWTPKVREGGILAGHDFPHDPVKKAVMEAIDAVPVSNRCWIRK